MKTKKRFLSILLSLVLMLGLLPGRRSTALAEEANEWSSLQAAINTAENGHTIKVSDYAGEDKTITASNTDGALLIEENKNITIDLAGCTLNGSSSQNYLIWVNGTLMITDSAGGGKIGGGTGGIVLQGGTLTMTGGTIAGNSDGGVVVDDNMPGMNSTFILNGGSIKGNTGIYGGGVKVFNGSFELRSGSITGNSATKGGGVYVSGGGTFTMTGGSITNNTASGAGGGVFAVSSSNGVVMTGGEISGNTAENYGGGVAIEYGPNAPVKFKVSGSPTVRGNKKLKDGTADDVSITTTVNPVMITGALTGGAIYISTNAGDGDIVVESDGSYQITDSDVEKLFFNGKDDALGCVLENGIVLFRTKATVDKAPGKSDGLVYTGSSQELVTAGAATDGEMQYALGNETEATQSFAASIPAATDAGTYYVWYMVKGDDNHADSDKACVTVTVSAADPTAPTGLTATYGQTLADVTLPAN